jgi:hypothetical protein
MAMIRSSPEAWSYSHCGGRGAPVKSNDASTEPKATEKKTVANASGSEGVQLLSDFEKDSHKPMPLTEPD